MKVHVARFVAFVKSGTLEGMPHTAFYGDLMFTRILNKPPWTTTTQPMPVLQRENVVVGTDQQGHKDGLCLWALAGMLEMTSKQTGALFTCRAAPGGHSIAHAPLDTVTVATVTRLLDDPEFTGRAKEAFTDLVRAKVETDTWRFLPE